MRSLQNFDCEISYIKAALYINELMSAVRTSTPSVLLRSSYQRCAKLHEYGGTAALTTAATRQNNDYNPENAMFTNHGSIETYIGAGAPAARHGLDKERRYGILLNFYRSLRSFLLGAVSVGYERSSTTLSAWIHTRRTTTTCKLNQTHQNKGYKHDEYHERYRVDFHGLVKF